MSKADLILFNKPNCLSFGFVVAELWFSLLASSVSFELCLTNPSPLITSPQTPDLLRPLELCESLRQNKSERQFIMKSSLSLFALFESFISGEAGGCSISSLVRSKRLNLSFSSSNFFSRLAFFWPLLSRLSESWITSSSLSCWMHFNFFWREMAYAVILRCNHSCNSGPDSAFGNGDLNAFPSNFSVLREMRAPNWSGIDPVM
mmetsp:Transcript_5385/g.8116  ORF Transcript_5385/g.8116 Transcript_5385/m.8116 type:complete len:204 (+) Transcript_5385:694-1305(+)